MTHALSQLCKQSKQRLRQLLLSVLLLAALVPWAQATDYGDVVVTAESVTAGGNGNNYDEYRITISNRSATKSYQVALSLVREVAAYGHGVRELRRTAEVAPAATISFPLFRPPLMPESGLIYVTIDGRLQREIVRVTYSRTNSWVSRSNTSAYVLLSSGFQKMGVFDSGAVAEGFKNDGGENQVAHLVYNAPFNEWSTHWLAYAQFDAVFLLAQELQAMPEAVRLALWRYAECGGTLFVAGDWPIPSPWQAGRQQVVGLDVDEDPLIEQVAKTEPVLPVFFVGFGQVLATGALDPKQITGAQWRAIRVGWRDSVIYNKDYYNLGLINQDFSVVDRISVPVRGLFGLMLLFVVVIGPLNILWLARRRRKIWLLWTVPAISLLTCLAVSAFAFLGEGINATARTESLTILDEAAHRATTIGWSAFYTPVTPSEGLHFSYDTQLIPQLAYFRDAGSSERVVDWTNDQHLAVDWITARVPTFFKFRRSETRRERLTINPAQNGSVAIVNGLGADIAQLWWADGKGRIHQVQRVAAGAEANLTATELQAKAEPGALREILSAQDWLEQNKLLAQNPEKYLRPGSYLAVLDAAPFAEEGLREVKVRNAKSYVYGLTAVEASPEGVR